MCRAPMQRRQENCWGKQEYDCHSLRSLSAPHTSFTRSHVSCLKCQVYFNLARTCSPAMSSPLALCMAVSIQQEPAYLDFVEVYILVSIIELQQGTIPSYDQLSAPWQHGCSTLLHPLAWQSVGVPRYPSSNTLAAAAMLFLLVSRYRGHISL